MADNEPEEMPAEKMTGFARRLRDRFGKAVDPHISLEPTADSGTSDEATDRATATSKVRIERLGALTPGEFRYKYKDEIGRGGMGVVLRVLDRDLGRHLAMKIIAGKGTSTDGNTPVDHSKLTRFLEEAQITGQLDHPGVVPVHELGMDARGRCFFTMRLVKGLDLKAVFGAMHSDELSPDKDLAGWTRNRALTSVHRVCQTMAFAHSKGVVHRDLKPANIMVGRFGETYVMDWGLAKMQNKEETRDLRIRTQDHQSVSFVHTDRMEETADDPDSPLVTMDGSVVGTPAYMAPEQAKGELEKVGPQSDVYSMGAILYHLLTGRAPYSEPGQNVGPHVTLMKVLGGPPVPLHSLRKDIPPELAAICEKAMAYSRKGRYEDMADLAEDLAAFQEGRVVEAHETGSLAEFKKWVERNRSFAAVITVAIVIVVSTLARISYVTGESNRTLGEKNTELIASKLEAESNANTALTNEAAATEAKEAAQRSEYNSTRITYISQVQATTSSLRVDDARAAAEHLQQSKGDFAGWEWDFLDFARDTSLQTFTAALRSPQQVAFSRDGDWVASLSENENHGIDLRNIRTGELRPTLVGHTQTVSTLAFSPDGRLLASGSADQSVRIWEVPTGRSITLPKLGVVEDIAFAPIGHQVAVAVRRSGSLPGTVKVFDFDKDLSDQVQTQPSKTFDCISQNATAVRYGPRGKRLIVASSAGIVQLWDMATHTTVSRLDTAESPISSLAIAPSGSQFAVATEDGVIRVAKTDSGAVIATRSLGVASANDCAFLDDERLMLACSDGVLRLFTHLDLALISVHGHQAELTTIAIGGLGEAFVTGSRDGTVKLWSGYSFLPTTTFPDHDGNPIRALAFAPNGDDLAASDNKGAIRIWNAQSGETKHLLLGHKQYAPALAYSHDGNWLASGSGDKTVRLWNTQRGELYSVWRGHTKWISDIQFSPDDRYIATSSGDQTVRIWDTKEERDIRTLEGHESWVHCLAWNENGTRLFTGDGDGQVIEWDPFRGEIVKRYQIAEKAITDLTLIEAQQTIAVSCLDSTLRLIKIGGEQFKQLEQHREGIAVLCLSPDGKRLVSGGMDGTLFVWDTSDWAMITGLHTGEINLAKVMQRQIYDVCFSPDGKRLASSQGTTVRTWETERPQARHLAMLEAQSVAGWVDNLFTSLGNPAEVLKDLQEDPDLNGKFRVDAILRATVTGNNPKLLVDRAWTILLDADSGDEGFISALTLAEIVFKEDPTNPDFKGAFAAANFRTGQYQSALEHLDGLLISLGNSHADRRPLFQIFRAMARFQTGQPVLAREELAGLREAMLRPTWQSLAGPLYAEAQALINSGE